MAGLDEWAEFSGGTEDMVHDPRLEKLLAVEGFRLPPVAKTREEADARRLPAVRFPHWLQCPKCHVIRHFTKWATADADASRWCATCTGARPKSERAYVVPVRFIRACDNGHIEDFPWNAWAQHKADCGNTSTLKLVSIGAGLGGLRLICVSCGGSRSMEAAFDKNVMAHFKCAGERPWLPGGTEADCDQKPRTLQRGASNLYFPVVQSSLLIPPWDDEIEERLGDRWADVLDWVPDERLANVRKLLEKGRVTIPVHWDRELFAERVVAQAAKRDGIDTTDLRREEWDQIVFSELGGAANSRDFEVHREKLPDVLASHLAHLIRVVRLRELRALRGFTRINPPFSSDDTSKARIAAMSRGQYPWLPAVEVRGEGVFLALQEDRLAAWENRDNVKARADRINAARRADHLARFGEDAELPEDLTPRYMLIHGVAHALMRQLSLECGYSTTSLRERLYAGPGRCGVLVYTATTDADGTLGGLQRQGEGRRMRRTFRDAIMAQRWCSSDPLCIRDVMMVSNASNLAACHACLLAPETSCEHFNQFLDRALIVGTPEAPEVGFFRDWLE